MTIYRSTGRLKGLTIATLTETCPGAPSQWEGTLTNGSSLYIRFRHGQLRVEAPKGTVILRWERLGDDDTRDVADSSMSLAEVLQYSGLALGDGCVPKEWEPDLTNYEVPDPRPSWAYRYRP